MKEEDRSPKCLSDKAESNNYLTSILQDPTVNVSIKKTASITANTIEERVKDNIRSYSIRNSLNDGLLTLPQINKNSLNTAELFEAKLNEMRNKQSERERKLKEIEDSINLINVKEKTHSWLSADERKKWRDDWEEKEKSAKEFTKKMKQVKAEIEKQKMEARKKEQMRTIIKEQKSQEIEHMMEEKKLKEIGERKLQSEQKKKDMVKFMNYAKVAAPRKEPLYARMEKEFENKTKMTELEKQKQMLAEKRSVPKLIRQEEIEERTRMLEDINKRKEETKRKAADMKIHQALYLQKVENKYRSAISKEVLRKDEEDEKAKKGINEQFKEKQNKRKEYAKLAQEAYAPRVSEKKVEELQRLINKLKHPTRKDRLSKSPTEGKQSRSISPSELTEELSRAKLKHKIVKPNPSAGNIVKKAKPIEKNEVSEKKNIKPPAPKYFDYWRNEIRHKITPKNIDGNNDLYFERVYTDGALSDKEKYTLIRKKANALTEIARRKESCLEVRPDIDLTEEVSDMYLNSIRAKLLLMDIKI